MDKYEGLMHVIIPSYPSLEDIPDAGKAIYLAKIYNDEMAECVVKYPDRFAAAVACLPMNDIDAALKEIDRVIRDLMFRGVLIYTPISEKPLDSPEFVALFEKMAEYNLPIWIHPKRAADYADYRTENKSLYEIHRIYGWPYETTVAMHRFVFSGILQKYPNLKLITHHCGGMVPYFADRITGFYDLSKMRGGDEYKIRLTRHPLEYFRLFYNDTAIYGNPAGLMCAYAFFGADHILFGTDMPHDNQLGDRYTRQTINAIEEMAINDLDKKKIFAGNVRTLLRLPV
jgi:predicted TIM-barrel fold metal-dependent hydrolase